MLKRVYFNECLSNQEHGYNGMIIEETKPNVLKFTPRGFWKYYTNLQGETKKEYYCNARIAKIEEFEKSKFI